MTPTIVTSEAEGYKYRSQANCKALRPLPESLQPILSAYSSESLQHPQQRQQPSQLFPPISADDGDDKQLSSLEREALRTRGQPGMRLAHDAVYGNASQSGVCGIVCPSSIRDSYGGSWNFKAVGLNVALLN